MAELGRAAESISDDAYPLIRSLPKNDKLASKSALRALDVLEYFSIVRRPVRAKAIAEAYHLHPSSAAQILKTMANAGYLVFDPIRKLYSPSPRLTRFAVWMTSGCFWNVDTTQVLQDLCANAQANVTMSVQNGNTMQIIDAVTVAQPNSIGFTMPLDSVHGQAFLATCSEEEAGALVSRAGRFRQLSGVSSQWLLERIAAAREAGYATGRSIDKDCWSIAMPVSLRSAASTVVVVGLTDTIERIRRDQDHLVAIMRHSVDQLVHADLALAPAQASV